MAFVKCNNGKCLTFQHIKKCGRDWNIKVPTVTFLKGREQNIQILTEIH